MGPSELVIHWREEAEVLHRNGDERGAYLARLHAEDLEAALREDGGEVLPLGQAAAESGYSADHLGRLIREGKIPNAGRPHAPRIRRVDLPRKATLSSPSAFEYEQSPSDRLYRDIANSKLRRRHDGSKN